MDFDDDSEPSPHFHNPQTQFPPTAFDDEYPILKSQSAKEQVVDSDQWMQDLASLDFQKDLHTAVKEVITFEEVQPIFNSSHSSGSHGRQQNFQSQTVPPEPEESFEVITYESPVTKEEEKQPTISLEMSKMRPEGVEIGELQTSPTERVSDKLAQTTVKSLPAVVAVSKGNSGEGSAWPEMTIQLPKTEEQKEKEGGSVEKPMGNFKFGRKRLPADVKQKVSFQHEFEEDAMGEAREWQIYSSNAELNDESAADRGDEFSLDHRAEVAIRTGGETKYTSDYHSTLDDFATPVAKPNHRRSRKIDLRTRQLLAEIAEKPKSDGEIQYSPDVPASTPLKFTTEYAKEEERVTLEGIQISEEQQLAGDHKQEELWERSSVVLHDRVSPPQSDHTKTLTYLEAWPHFEQMDISDYVEQEPVMRPVRISWFRRCFTSAGDEIEVGELKEKCRRILVLVRIPLDNSPLHQDILFSVWKLLTGRKSDCPRFGTHWDEIGFQGSDPATDLRGVGMFGLLQMLYLCSNFNEEARMILALAQQPHCSFPFAAVSLNITKIAVEALREQCLNVFINKWRNVFDSVVVIQVQFFFVGTFLYWFQLYSQRKLTIADVGALTLEVSRLSKRHPNRIFQQLKQGSTLTPRTLPAINSLRFLTNEQLILLSKDLGSQDSSQSAWALLSPYLSVLSRRTGTMSVPELVQLLKAVAGNEAFAEVTSAAVKRLSPQVTAMSYQDCVDFAKVVGASGGKIPGTIDLLETMAKELTEIAEYELVQKPTSSFSVILKAFSGAQAGDGDFYKSLVEILLVPQRLETIPTLQLLRFAVYIRRVKKLAGRGGFGLYAAVEKRLWDDIHQQKCTSLPTLLRIFSDLIPSGLGSTKLQLLLEYSLHQQLLKPDNAITATQVVQLLEEASNYIFKYKPLFLLVQQLVVDALPMLSLKDAVGVVWALGKNNKDCGELLKNLLGNVLPRLEHQHCNLRTFTFLLNGCLNSGQSDPELIQRLAARLKTYTQKPADCHYWVKSLGILSALGALEPPLLTSVLSLASDARNTIKGADVIRLMCLAVSTPAVLAPYVSVFESGLKAELKQLPTPMLARLAHVAGSVTGFSGGFLGEVEQELKGRNLMSIKPTDLAAASAALADARRSGYVIHCVPALQHFLDVLRQRVVEVSSDSESESSESVLQEDEIRFGAEWELTAAALVQICWTLAAADVRSAGVWSDKLMRSIQRVRVNAENRFEINHWKTTAMAILAREEYFSTVDLPHFAMLLNSVAIVKGVEEAKSILALSSHILSSSIPPLHIQPEPNFLQSVLSFCEANCPSAKFNTRDSLLNSMDILMPNNTCILCYSDSQMVSGRLRTTFEMKHRVLQLQGYTVKVVRETEWEGRGETAKRRLLAIV